MGMRRTGLPVEQTPGAYRRNVGAIKIATIHDGTLSTSFNDVVGADARLCEAAHRAAMRSVPPRFTCNIFVIDNEKELLLIDAGCGQTAPEAGRAPDGLELLGIDPKHIDAVLMTHMHRDHAGGLIRPDGSPRYPRAELIMHENELEFWQDSANLARLSQSQQVDFVLANAVFGAYADRLRPVKDNEIQRGLTAVSTPGHTPGHTAWLIDSDGEQLLIWGDVIHFPGFQFAIPEASVRYDLDPEAAASARRRVLDMVSSNRIPVAGVHLDFPSYGRVRALPDGTYSYVSEIWTSDLPVLSHGKAYPTP